MNRSFLIVSLIVGLAGAAGCGGSKSNCQELTAPSGPTYTISGVVTAYGGEPLSGATVSPYPSEGSCNGTPETHTDQQGHYNWSAPGSATVSLVVGQSGYESAYKNNLSAQQPTADFILHSLVTMKPSGDALAGIVRGDEFIAGDDVFFGGLCAHTACKIVEFDLRGVGFQFPAVKRVEIRLRWNDPEHQLALYISHVGNLEDPPFTSGATAERHCCSAELVGTADLDKYFPDVFAVAFEQAARGLPVPSDSQAFELTVRPMP